MAIVFRRPQDRVDWNDGPALDDWVRVLGYEAEEFLRRRGHQLIINRIRGGFPTSGVHADGRAEDISILKILEAPDYRTLVDLVEYLNTEYPWPKTESGKLYPTAILEWPSNTRKFPVPAELLRTVTFSDRATGPHLHIQVPRRSLGDVGWVSKLGMPSP